MTTDEDETAGRSWRFIAFRLGRIVLLVLAILLVARMILFPSEGYTVRAQVSEGLSLAEGSRTAVTEYYVAHRAFPSDNGQARLEAPQSIMGTYVSSVTIDNGAVVVIFGGKSDSRIMGKALVLRPHPVGAQLVWDCTSKAGTTVPTRQRPTMCR